MKTYNLLTEPLITIQGGNQLTLPQTLLAIDAGEITCFPRLLPYHIKTWHAFLVQLAVLASTKVGKKPETVDEWHDALVALTSGEEYWDLISAPGEPAFMQTPLTTEHQLKVYKDSKKDPKRTPDGLDILVTANNHFVKQERNVDAPMEDWLYALVVHQTEASYVGARNYGTARAASGQQARVFAGVFPIQGKSLTINPSLWFKQDFEAIMEKREAASSKEKKRFSKPGVLWHLKWDFDYEAPKPKGDKKGDEDKKQKNKAPVVPKNSIRVTSLDPIYIDQARVVKLFRYEKGIEAITQGSTASRVYAGDFQRDTDPWAILGYKEGGGQKGYVPWGFPEKSPRAFDYRMISGFLTSDDFRFAHREYVDWEADNLGLYVDFIRKGQGKTLGHKHAFLPLPREAKDIFFGGEDSHSVMNRMLELTSQKSRAADRSVRVYLARGNLEQASDFEFMKKPKISAACGYVADAIHTDINGYFMREWADLVDVADDDEAFEARFSKFERKVMKSCKVAFEEFLSRRQVPSSSRLRSEARSRDVFYEGMQRKAA